jgi:hypothetical protein
MGLYVEKNKRWVWDNEESKLVLRTEVYVQLIGTHGTIFFNEGPIYCKTEEDTDLAEKYLTDILMNKAFPGQGWGYDSDTSICY